MKKLLTILLLLVMALSLCACGDVKVDKENTDVPSSANTDANTDAKTDTAQSPIENAMPLAGSLKEAFKVAGTGLTAENASTQTIQNPSKWYGWMKLSDIWGVSQKDELDDVWGFIDTDTKTGKTYFEVYQDGDSQNAFLSMYITIADDGMRILPDIGQDDAWISDSYLLTADASKYEMTLDEGGALTLQCEYVSTDGSRGCQVEIFLRVDGTAWDEANDTLPPRYDEYKAALLEENAN